MDDILVGLDPKVVEEQARLLQQANSRKREHDLQREDERDADGDRDLHDFRHRHDETLYESDQLHEFVSQPPPPPAVLQTQQDEWDFTIHPESASPTRQTSHRRREGETRGTLSVVPSELGS